MERLTNKLFVYNIGDSSVSMIDTENLKEITRIYLKEWQDKSSRWFYNLPKPVPGPHGILSDREKKNLYLVDSYHNNICIVDLESLKVRDTFYAGSNPMDMALNEDGSCLYVSDGDSNSVSVIDVSTRRIVSQVPTGNMPCSICLSPDGEYLYTANMDSKDITVIDTWSNSNISSAALKGYPVSIIASTDGLHIYAACGSIGCGEGGLLSVLSLYNLRVQKYIEFGGIPSQMELSRHGDKLYLVDTDLGELIVVDLNMLKIAAKTRTGKIPCGIAVDRKGNIFISNSEDNNISVIDEDTLKLKCTIEAGLQPASMCILS